MPMASRLEVRVEVRDCAKFVKVVIEKVDVAKGSCAQKYSGSICDKITSHRRPSDLLGQLLKKKHIRAILT